MAASISSSPTIIVQEIIEQFHSRKLLQYSPFHQSPTAAPLPIGNSHDSLQPGDNSFDANVITVLSVLLCALICSLGLNSIIRCALRCSSVVSSPNPGDNSAAARLANTGIKKKALKTFPVINYTSDLKHPGLDSACAICLSEFAPGERVRMLPKCNHGFHVRCIDRWLNSHSSCPSCRHCLIETCQKIVGGAATPASTSRQPAPVPLPPQETIVRIAPLESEGVVRNYQI